MRTKALSLFESCLFLLCLWIALACEPAAPPPGPDSPPGSQGNGAATPDTIRANAEFAAALPLDDPRDFEDAERGLVARDTALHIRREDGETIWRPEAYAFENGEAPNTVNPSLWRQAKLNNLHGLYRVTDRVYQVRGYDLANMTIILGDTGWIVVDPLTSRETAEAALSMARAHLGEAPIVAVIVTHSHIDHFGGMQAAVSAEDAATGRVRVIAPRHFTQEATSENVLAGMAMGRRASFMYGFPLERGPRGHVGSGLGKAPTRGAFGIVPPNEIIDETGQTLEIDGVEFVFLYAPDSEAPAELMFYLPDSKVLCGAEVVSRNMHNLYTLRGAKVRDPLKWSGYIDEARRLHGEAEIIVNSHHWPVWGNAQVLEFLEKQRDVYKYIHDQTLRMANAGLTSREIAEAIALPPELANYFAIRGYYGTTKHNAKAVYQHYFGWYDGNPANLDPLPPEAEAKKYVEFMGGAAAVLEKARASVEAGEYRWAATVLNKLVFAHPDDAAARALLADVYDQLGYRAESGPWRDVYLSAALELRHGMTVTAIRPADAVDLLLHVPIERFFDAMAARVIGPEASGKEMTFNFVFTDLQETVVVRLENAVMNHWKQPAVEDANATITLTLDLWVKLATRAAGPAELALSEDFQIEGSSLDLIAFFRLLDSPDGRFAIVTP